MKLLLGFLFSLAVVLAQAQVPSLNDLAGDWQDAAEVRSLPPLNCTQGSAQAVRDVLAVGKLSFPPITMTGDTGALLIDGQAPTLKQTRWFPCQVLRTATVGSLALETTTRMPCEQRGVLFHVVVTNTGSAAQTFELKIPLSAGTSRHTKWGWGIPRDKDAGERFTAVVTEDRQALVLRDATNQLANCFAFERPPDELSVQAMPGRRFGTSP